MGYYDIDDVLTDACEIPCKFKHDIPGLGYLENNPGKPIRNNSKLLLPLWLARILAIVGEDPVQEDGTMLDDAESIPFVELMTPDAFSAKVINAIKADPVSLDVHSISPHFFALAIKWIALFNDKELAAIVTELMLQRAQEINNHASSVTIDVKRQIDITGDNSTVYSTNAGNLGNNNNSTFLLTLDEFEKRVYKQAHESYKDAKRWMYHK
ncbi:hypothetical protein KAFR_0A08670 [Kazachstania africana CBS 2517]|uniref:DNA replication complex GINS protein PSF3 n=1 Tax=Kazachstania africana (strain ATCC 22294 / BCRC 22015 / CBS 2517 / CECT 1963 / NBRC 1671 / NRRL Y-8276) TaxID=1071382 RepID=H2APK1_KAZAF|nr:hypothetical protein KAFR_0A08670 [Kazachstania africana CBS 2517]CCF56301.1 hypothetical protein KAFR_0A08670 [Kazachstania africana CBS 2517]